ncbi:unnamed protein product [Rotaria sordida]|uniref:Uncharacterized protein n=1 Tax=Rotaria sordida TaxID=392033 RepID=A0A814GZG1_9BILA|nr:unnamed protein product [Rotaria sordida]
MIERKELHMSQHSYIRTNSVRKSIKPTINHDEDEDDKRRDVSGRKRVDVIHCLLESSSSSSSSDENDNTKVISPNPNKILWLTFAEICHIRSVLTQTTLNTRMLNEDKQHSKIFHNDICFSCQKKINSLSFISTIFSSNNSSICYICQQKICRKCSVTNFLPPSSKHHFPVRIQALIKVSSTSIKNEINTNNKLIPKAKTICYDCSQIFAEYKRSSQYPIQTPPIELHQSRLDFNLSTQDSDASVRLFEDNIEEPNIDDTVFITQF